MSDRRQQWVRVTRSEPCAVCGKPDYCTRSTDGQVAHCMRIESGKSLSKGGWLHKLSEPLPPKPAPKEVEKKKDWTAECRRLFEHRQAKAKREQVAEQLGVTPGSLELLRVGVGWDQHDGREFSSWPSRDDTGICIGYVRRYGDGAKKTNRGGSTGLFYTANWNRHPEPVLIVEGGSDVAACESKGLAAIGRPSNVYGAHWIRRMLRGKPAVVIGERDEKPEKRGTVSNCPNDCRGCAFCWPGLFGMEKVARELRVGWFMPAGYKDMRELLLHVSAAEFLTALKKGKPNGGSA